MWAADCGGVSFGEPNWVGTVETSKINEASGIVTSRINPAVLWTHNDGAGGKVYAIATNGVLYGSFDLSKTVDDTEDIAMGPGPLSGKSYIYVGDIGSNDASRSKVRILRTPEPAIDPSWAQNPVSKNIDSVEVFELKYPDGEYNAEALLVDGTTGELLVATKETSKSRIYRAPLSSLVDGQTSDLEFIREIDFPVVSGGDISADGRYVALRNETMAFLWTKQPGESAGDALGGTGTAIPLVGKPEEPNGEALGFTPDGSGYYTISEGSAQPVYFFPRMANGGGTIQFTSAPQRVNNSWQFNFSGCPGSQVTLYRSTDLIDWEAVQSKTATGGSDSFLDSQANLRSFYRLALAP